MPCLGIIIRISSNISLGKEEEEVALLYTLDNLGDKMAENVFVIIVCKAIQARGFKQRRSCNCFLDP